MFYYNNEMVQFIVPLLFYLLVLVLYLNSTQQLAFFYQMFIPRITLPFLSRLSLQMFIRQLVIQDDDRKIYTRIGIALLITLPFLALFIGLLFSADIRFVKFLGHLFDFELEIESLINMPILFLIYLYLFIYTFSNQKDRTLITATEPLDRLIVGIFLGMINLLFITFIMVQIPFLLGDNYLPEGVSLAKFAREGFFQLMVVMGIVFLIFLFIMRRFKGESTSLFLMVGLLLETIMMGIISLKKMYLYQNIKGATVLRYYVEWFDYFLILILALGIGFMIRKIAFERLLNIVSILGMVAFAIVISLNIDLMVASHNIDKFRDNSQAFDKEAISRLSIDALPAIQGMDIIIYSSKIRECERFSDYHYGYCHLLNHWGDTQYNYREIEQYR